MYLVLRKSKFQINLIRGSESNRNKHCKCSDLEHKADDFPEALIVFLLGLLVITQLWKCMFYQHNQQFFYVVAFFLENKIFHYSPHIKYYCDPDQGRWFGISGECSSLAGSPHQTTKIWVI
jgi:hypothetical protein